MLIISLETPGDGESPRHLITVYNADTLPDKIDITFWNALDDPIQIRSVARHICNEQRKIGNKAKVITGVQFTQDLVRARCEYKTWNLIRYIERKRKCFWTQAQMKIRSQGISDSVFVNLYLEEADLASLYHYLVKITNQPFGCLEAQENLRSITELFFSSAIYRKRESL